MRLPPTFRAALARQQAEDPLDAEGTHPPIPQRIAALNGLPSRPEKDTRRAITYLPDLREHEGRQSRKALRGLTLEEPKAWAAFVDETNLVPKEFVKGRRAGGE
jgi:hypothetical protein